MIATKINNNCYKKTERRLYAYNDINAKLKQDMLDLEDLKKEKVSGKSKDILYRSVSGGIWLSPEELQELKINSLWDTIKRNSKEINTINSAIGALCDDYYTKVIILKYFDRKTDEQIAELINCDPSTVRRNKKRLVNRISIRLYGEEALDE